MDKVSSIFATEIKIEVAKNFWIEAKSASFFCHPSYLIEMGYKFKYFGAYKGEELLCVWPLLIEQDENLSIPNYSYFFGPFFKHDSADLPSYKSYSNNLQLINCLIKCVISESNNLSFSLLPEFQDIRPFSWWNYHKPDLPKFQIEVRYTGGKQKKLSGIAPINNLIKIVARMLVLGYLPLSFDDHGIGQCIGPQNVTTKGGICDLGSLHSISNVKTDKEFYQLLSSLCVVLTQTTKELLLDTLPNLVYEFNNPTTSTFLTANIISRRLITTYELEVKKAKCKPDQRIMKFFKSDNDKFLGEVLNKMFN